MSAADRIRVALAGLLATLAFIPAMLARLSPTSLAALARRSPP